MKKFLAVVTFLVLIFSLAAVTACSAQVTTEHTYEKMLADTTSYSAQIFKIRLRIKVDTKTQTVLKIEHIFIPSGKMGLDGKEEDATHIAQGPGTALNNAEQREQFLKQLEGLSMENFKNLPGLVYYHLAGVADLPEYIARFSDAMSASENFVLLISKAFVIDAVAATLKHARLI